ncbi:hypothetical protein Nmel_009100 [Mimus melanotis]
MASARHDILILTMSGSMSLLLQIYSNPLTTEDCTGHNHQKEQISLQIQDSRTIHYAFLEMMHAYLDF